MYTLTHLITAIEKPTIFLKQPNCCKRLLTLGAHVHEGYSTLSVCLLVSSPYPTQKVGEGRYQYTMLLAFFFVKTSGKMSCKHPLFTGYDMLGNMFAAHYTAEHLALQCSCCIALLYLPLFDSRLLKRPLHSLSIWLRLRGCMFSLPFW